VGALFPYIYSGGAMSIKNLVSDINSAVERWTDYQEDNKAGEENIPFDCIADAYAYRKNEIDQSIIDTLAEDGISTDNLDLDCLVDRLLHFNLEYETGHIFSGLDDDKVYFDHWPLGENHMQFDIDQTKHGRITPARLKVIEREIDAVISSYQEYKADNTIQSIDLCWPTDAVWIVYVSKDAIIEAYHDITEED
jgi:hypothetical protein